MQRLLSYDSCEDDTKLRTEFSSEEEGGFVSYLEAL